jgi:hypothetical protein
VGPSVVGDSVDEEDPERLPAMVANDEWAIAHGGARRTTTTTMDG